MSWDDRLAETVRLNSRRSCPLGSFQDCCLRPLGHVSWRTAWRESDSCEDLGPRAGAPCRRQETWPSGLRQQS